MTYKALGCLFAASLFVTSLGSAQNAAESSATLHANANLVVVDVVVTDSHQNPVHGLSVTDFSVAENGKAQTIKTFEEHVATEGVKLPPMPKLEPGTFTNYSPTPVSGALNILLLDRLNTPMKDQPVVREQVLKYLKEARSGTRIAIFGLNTQLRLLQGFTSDPEVLRAALNGKKAGAQGSPLLNNAVSGDGPGADDPMMDAVRDSMGNSPSGSEVLANLQQYEAEMQSFQLQLRARYTLDAFSQLGHFLSRLPGRKNLIWFSGSFPINILPDPDLENPFGVAASYADEFRETVNLLARAQVAVYPIDARGLMSAPMMDVANSGRNYTRNPGNFAKDQSKFFQQTADEHGTMTAMAEATGGKAFVDTNGLKEAVEKAVETGSNYYTLAYSPTNHDWKGDYRKIQVNLAQHGFTLAYRRGYFADNPDSSVHHGEPRFTAKEDETHNPMRAAMQRGGPDPIEILFEASVLPTTAEQESTLVPGNKADAKIKGPYRRFTVRYAVKPTEIASVVTPEGVRTIILEFITFVYDAEGVLINMQSDGIKAEIPAARYAALQRSGFQFKQEISVPVKGESFLRIGMHDMQSNHVGAVEVPVSSVSKLTPLSAQAIQPPAAAK